MQRLEHNIHNTRNTSHLTETLTLPFNISPSLVQLARTLLRSSLPRKAGVLPGPLNNASQAQVSFCYKPARVVLQHPFFHNVQVCASLHSLILVLHASCEIIFIINLKVFAAISLSQNRDCFHIAMIFRASLFANSTAFQLNSSHSCIQCLIRVVSVVLS